MTSKWPQVTSDGLSGLNNPCSSACLALKGFFEPFVRKEGRKEGQNGHVDMRARTSPQVKSIELRGSYSAGSVWHAPVAQEGVFCGRRFRWHCGSEVGLDERDDDPAVKEDALSLVLKIK